MRAVHLLHGFIFISLLVAKSSLAQDLATFNPLALTEAQLSHIDQSFPVSHNGVFDVSECAKSHVKRILESTSLHWGDLKNVDASLNPINKTLGLADGACTRSFNSAAFSSYFDMATDEVFECKYKTHLIGHDGKLRSRIATIMITTGSTLSKGRSPTGVCEIVTGNPSAPLNVFTLRIDVPERMLIWDKRIKPLNSTTIFSLGRDNAEKSYGKLRQYTPFLR